MSATQTLDRDELRGLERSLRSARARLERSLGPTGARRNALRRHIALAAKGDVGSALAVALNAGARTRHQQLVEAIRRLEMPSGHQPSKRIDPSLIPRSSHHVRASRSTSLSHSAADERSRREWSSPTERRPRSIRNDVRRDAHHAGPGDRFGAGPHRGLAGGHRRADGDAADRRPDGWHRRPAGSRGG